MANYIDTTADAAIIPEVWGNLALGHLPAYLNLGRTVAKDSDLGGAFNEGDIIHVSRRGALSANQMVENSSVTVQKPSRTDITVTLNNHYEVTFGELDIARALSRGTSMSEYASDAVMVLAEKIEDSIAALHTSLTNTVTATSDAEDDILTLRERMVGNKVPRFAPKYLYTTPGQMKRFQKVARATESDKVGNASQNPTIDPDAGLVFHGVNIFESQMVRATGSPVAYHSFFYTKNAIVLAMRPMPLPEAGTGGTGAIVRDANGFVMRVVKSWNPDYLSNQLTTDVLWGTAILDNRLIVEFESTV